MTENIPGAAGPTPERPEQPAEPAAQHEASPQAQPYPSTPGTPEWSPWAPQGQERPAQEQGLPGQEPPAGQPWQQGATQQPVGGPQQTAAFAQPGYAQMPSGANPYVLTAEQPHGVYTTPRKPGRTKLVVGVAVLALLVGGGAGAFGGYLTASSGAGSYNSVFAPPAANASNVTPGSVTDVANKVLPTVVEIKTQEGEGSGFIVSSDGQIITNNHVIASAAGGGQIEVDFQNGKTATAKIIGRDPTTDVAVIKAQNVSGLPTAQLGTSNGLQIGSQVVAIGSPFDLAGTVTTGIVSSMHRPVNVGDELNEGQQQGQGQGGGGLGGGGGFPGFGGGGQQQQQQQTPQVRQDTVLDAIQTDAAINPGNSGGPLVNMQGQVIGMNSAISSPNSSAQSQGGSVGIGFAIPIDQAKRTAQQIIQTGKATQAQLGVSVTDPTNGQGGAVIGDVTAGGAAEKAGLKKNDVVTKINDRVITDSDSLVAAVHAAAPGETITITLSGGNTLKATLTGKTIDVQN
ncbi:trypsin-like peptidase domain-containing protein [Kutzneria sp. NPDC051319]|uniref:S1C family serine protease n=1 Tax=Kutzneria sp. NPDC051319 TaxID=3155047 RepID=UPI00341E9B33